MKRFSRTFAVLAIVGAASLAFVAAGPFAGAMGKPSYLNGVYEGSAPSHGGELTVTVTVKKSKIASVAVKATDSAGISDAAIAKIPAAIVKAQGVEVDAVAGASETSEAIKAAAAKALAGATLYPVASTMKTDVVVIGGGNAGLAAAVEAANAGAKVILVEKMAFLGGNTIRAGGAYNAVDPERQSRQGIEDSIDKHFQQTYEGGDKKADPALVRTFVEGAPEGLKWLEGMGMKFNDKVFTVLGALWPRSHATVDPVGTGFIKTLKAAADGKGVKVLLETKADQILREDGKVTGIVVVDAAGKRVRINAARGVVLATGGFAANKEMRQAYDSRITPNLGTTNHPGAMGDGIVMAERIGAALVGMEYIQMLPLGDPKTGVLEGWVGFNVEDYIYVNKDGKRFVSEAERRDVMTQALIKQRDQYMFVLCDAHSMPTPQSKNSFNESAEDCVKKGTAFTADTIEELAVKIGVDPAALRATIDEYNRGVEAKSDALGKKLLGNKLDKAPYYASPRVPTVHHTMGGVKIDTACRVIDAKGAAIPGLYAAGEVTGGIHGSNRLGGNALADTIVFGRIAGKNAGAKK
ncbi:MAG: flavocytochrome c [Spirochaetaceae bacterium]|nr:flavocytochrome c [Spirochaetaceae bacterium]